MQRQKICCLEDRCKALELRESSAVGPVVETRYETGCKPPPFNESIFIVGGYDGSSHLSASYLYSPHEDIMTSLSPMRFVRSQASVAKLRGELYVFGGFYDDVWHDTGTNCSHDIVLAGVVFGWIDCINFLDSKHEVSSSCISLCITKIFFCVL